jgi:hypothetical protein
VESSHATLSAAVRPAGRLLVFDMQLWRSVADRRVTGDQQLWDACLSLSLSPCLSRMPGGIAHGSGCAYAAGPLWVAEAGMIPQQSEATSRN